MQKRIFKTYFFNFQIYNTVLLGVLTMLYITSPDLFILYMEVYLLTTFTHFTHPQPPPLATTNLFSASIILSFVFLFALDSTYKWDHMVFVFLCPMYLT